MLTAHGKSTLAELAEQTSLSSRVVRYNLDIVKSWMRACDVQFINRPGYGLEVVASQEKRSELLESLNQLDDCDIILTSRQRVRVILLYLLTSAKPVSAQEISEVGAFSRSTLFKDLNEIESWLAKFRIVLIRRSAMGLWIDGSEESRRFALVRLLREEMGREYWVFDFSEISKPRRVKFRTGFPPALTDISAKLDLPFAWRLFST